MNNIISKPNFLQTMTPIAARYAAEVIEEPEKHEDAVKACMQDFMNGAVIAYDKIHEYESED